MNPTAELYNALEVAYAHYNKSLFEGKLPSVIFTNQRQKGSLGPAGTFEQKFTVLNYLIYS